jgi:hypothetical protein
MALENVAYLVISSDLIGDGDGVFELHHDLEIESRVEKDYLVGNFGTAVEEAIRYARNLSSEDVLEDPDISENARRTGYSVDAGGGRWEGAVTFSTGLEDATWGDGSGGDGPENVTKTDASGTDVPGLQRLQVLQYWIANTLSDSRGRVRVHIGEWTDGSLDDYRDGAHVSVDAGVYDRPFPVAILNCEPRAPPDQPGTSVATLNYRRTQIPEGLPEDLADWISATGQDLLEATDFAEVLDA